MDERKRFIRKIRIYYAIELIPFILFFICALRFFEYINPLATNFFAYALLHLAVVDIYVYSFKNEIDEWKKSPDITKKEIRIFNRWFRPHSMPFRKIDTYIGTILLAISLYQILSISGVVLAILLSAPVIVLLIVYQISIIKHYRGQITIVKALIPLIANEGISALLMIVLTVMSFIK